MSEKSSVEPGLVSRRPVHDGRIVHLSVDTVRMPDGSQKQMEHIRHAGASAILPMVGSIDDADPEILLIRQYRYSAGDWLYEVPAGTRGEGEPFEDVARRELEEETGWRAGKILPLTRIYTTPGFTDEVIHLWLASELEKSATKLDEDEFVEVVPVRFSTALQWIREGRIIDGKSLATLLYAAQFIVGKAPAG
jgi:ADP-ribose pyrophosphatase